jgi:hypothetical protein
MSIGSIGSSTAFDPTQMAAKFFKKADANGDGSIDKSELKTMLSNGPKGKSMSDADVDKIFSTIDTNGDGKIDEAENATQMKKMGGGKDGPPPSGGMPPGGASKAAGGSQSSSKVYDSRDTNKDGTVSYQEQLDYDLKHPQEADSATDAQQSSTRYNRQGSASTASAAQKSMFDMSV